MPLLTRQDYSSDMTRIYEALLLEEHNNALYQQSLQGEPRTPEIGISNPGFLEEEKPTVVTTKLGMLGIPEARDRRMSTASMISAISRRSHVPRGDAKDDKTALKSALKDTSALGRTKMGMQRWKEGKWFEVIIFPLRHLAGETEQELRREAELLQLATSGRGHVTPGGESQPVEEEQGRKISQSWLNAAERISRKTSVVSKEHLEHFGGF